MEQPTTRSRAALPSLMEELVEEILLRLPPEEPAHLVRAAMVCKAWCRLLSDAGFRRRYYRFHRARAMLLGYVCGVSTGAGSQFVPTTGYFSPPPLPARCGYSALDCRHGRVLIQVSSKDGSPEGLIVWSLVTGSSQHLSFPAAWTHQWTYSPECSFTGAVLCARHQHGGCDHLDCHGGPFLVVCMEAHDAAGAEHRTMHTRVSVYSSETGAWSAQTTCCADQNYYNLGVCMRRSLLIGDALYFSIVCDHTIKIIKYDLCVHGLSVIDAPQVEFNKALLIDIDGGIGILQYDHDCSIYTWSRQHVDAYGVGEWVNNNVVALDPLIPTINDVRCSYGMSVHFAEGTNAVLLCLYSLGVFTLDLNSRQLREVNFNRTCDDDILPYVSFYIPDIAKGKLSPR